MITTTLRAAGYARYSSDLQRETSLEDQIAGHRRYADQQGWTMVDEYILTDAGVSGASLDGRPGIQALFAAAARRPRPFDVVLMDDTSRFSRNIADAIRGVERLTFCGVRVIFTSQGIDTASEQAPTLVAVHGIVDQLYIRELRHKIKRGLHGQLERGYATGAKTYGYTTTPVPDSSGKRDANGPVVIGKAITVDPDAARTIVALFEGYANGTPIPQMIERLTRDGIPAPRGGRWTLAIVHRILKNEKYRGLQIYGQTRSERVPGTHRRVLRPQPRETWHVCDRPDLRIVSDALWRQVADRRAAIQAAFTAPPGPRPPAQGRSALSSPHLFSGFMRCGTCGFTVCTVAGGQGSPRYGCPNSSRNGLAACDNRLTIRAKVADPLLLAGLQAELIRPTWVEAITDAVTQEVRRALTQHPHRHAALKKRRETVARKLDSLLAAVEDGGVPLGSLRARISERDVELRGIDADLVTHVNVTPVDVTVIPTWVRRQLENLNGLLKDAPLRAKAEFQRLQVQFVLTPVLNDGRPFLRAVGTGDLSALCRVTDLPRSNRGRPKVSSGCRSTDLPTALRSLQ